MALGSLITQYGCLGDWGTWRRSGPRVCGERDGTRESTDHARGDRNKNCFIGKVVEPVAQQFDRERALACARRTGDNQGFAITRHAGGMKREGIRDLSQRNLADELFQEVDGISNVAKRRQKPS